MCPSFTMAHLLPGRGPAFVRDPRRFPVLAHLAACLSIRRGVTRSPADASPSLLHQGPRYYQLGRGGFGKLTAHAVSRVLITRSDSGRTQLNYSELMGGVSAAAISTYTYHPQSERSFSNVMSVWGTQMVWDAATYMIKEFWPDLRKKIKNSH
jgi:hypothetical protein